MLHDQTLADEQIASIKKEITGHPFETEALEKLEKDIVIMFLPASELLTILNAKRMRMRLQMIEDHKKHQEILAEVNEVLAQSKSVLEDDDLEFPYGDEDEEETINNADAFVPLEDVLNGTSEIVNEKIRKASKKTHKTAIIEDDFQCSIREQIALNKEVNTLAKEFIDEIDLFVKSRFE